MSTISQEAPAMTVPGRPRRVRTYLAGIFPESDAPPVSRRKLLIAVLSVAVGTVVSLGRTTGTGPLQTIWEEDARDLLTDALLRPGAYNLVKPYVGYFQIGPRALAEVAAFFPISWAAAVLSIEAALITALLTLAVYVASGTHLRHPLARFLVAAPMLFSPTAENSVSEIYNRPATLQFFVVYAVFWLLLWVPVRSAGRLVQLGVVGLSAFSTFLVVLFIPLSLLRLYLRRDRTSLALLGFLVAGAVLQVAGLSLGLTNRAFAVPRYEPVWAMKSFVVWAVPHSMVGYRAASQLGDSPNGADFILVALPWLAIAAVVVVAVRRFTRPAWLLAAVAGAHCVGLTCMTVMANGVVTQRYLLPVEMLLFAALTALMLPADNPRPAAALAPLALFTAAVLAVSAVNYRWDNTYRAHSPRWSDQVKRAAIDCRTPGRREVTIRSGPEPYFSKVMVPCHYLQPGAWCQPPFCAEIGALPAPVDWRRPADGLAPRTDSDRPGTPGRG